MRLCCSATGVTGQDSTGLLSLDAAEPLEFIRLHGNLSTKADLAGGTSDERHSVGVQRLVDRSSTRGGTGERNARLFSLSDLTLGTDSQPFDNGSLHSKLDEIEGHEPDDVPDPDDTNPSTGYSVDLGEAPVTEASDDGRDELSNTEGNHQGGRGTLHEEEAVRTGDEDESLGDDGDLEVDNHVELTIVGIDRGSGKVLEGDTELVLEEVGLKDHNDKDNGRNGQVQSVGNSKGKDLSQVPTVRCHRGQDTIDGKSHDGTVVQQSDDKDHEGREVEFVGKGEDGEADDDTDGNGAGVDGVVPHTLEDDTRSADGVNDGR